MLKKNTHTGYRSTPIQSNKNNSKKKPTNKRAMKRQKNILKIRYMDDGFEIGELGLRRKQRK